MQAIGHENHDRLIDACIELERKTGYDTDFYTDNIHVGRVEWIEVDKSTQRSIEWLFKKWPKYSMYITLEISITGSYA